MQRISLSWFSQLGVALRPLGALRNAEKFEWSQFVELHTAKGLLDALADSRISHLHLRVSRKPLSDLISQIDAVIGAGPGFDESTKEFNARKFAISYYWDQLSPILDGELSIQNCYLVWSKRAYDTEMLAEDGLKMLSEATQDGLSKIERYDINQAGRCLAFEVPTAALFHMFRAADSVIRRWYKQITGTEPTVKMRSWGVYIKNLRKCGANEKILSALDQIKDLHRNPVVHPEAEISIEEALSFIGIAESIISTIIADMAGRSELVIADLLSAAASTQAALEDQSARHDQALPLPSVGQPD
jgi:hypothetical protein